MTTRRILRAVLTAALLAVLLASCDGVVTGAGRTCTVKPNTPHQSTGSSEYIVGKAQIKCDGAAIVNYYVRLQKRVSSGSWTQVDDNDGQIDSVQSQKQQVRQASVLCASGTYRLRAKINIIIGSTTYYGDWTYSPTRTNPCNSAGGGGGGGGGGSW
jgi:hypothetical protein